MSYGITIGSSGESAAIRGPLHFDADNGFGYYTPIPANFDFAPGSVAAQNVVGGVALKAICLIDLPGSSGFATMSAPQRAQIKPGRGEGSFEYWPLASDTATAGVLAIKIKIEDTDHVSRIAEHDLEWSERVIDPALSSGDITPPVVTIVSPTPGVAAGQPGGFPSDPAAAQATPVVLRVVDAVSGVGYACIVFRRLPLYVGEVVAEEVVYRHGSFRAGFLGSTLNPIAGGFELTIRRTGGWPAGTSSMSDLTFEVDAIDNRGNLAP